MTSLRLVTAVALLVLAGAASALPVSLSWAEPTEGAPVDHYNLYWSQDGGSFRVIQEVETNGAVVEIEAGVEYRFRVSAVSSYDIESGLSEESIAVYVPEGQTQGSMPPPTPEFRPNVPNPFNPETVIRYGVPQSHTPGSGARLHVYDVRGQLVRNLTVDETPGWHEARWNGRGDDGSVQPSGTYYVRLYCAGEVATWKVMMIK